MGRPPFRGATEYLTFEAVLAHDLSYAGSPEPPRAEAAALIESFLSVDPGERIGAAGGAAAVQAHAFFDGTDWCGAGELVSQRLVSEQAIQCTHRLACCQCGTLDVFQTIRLLIAGRGSSQRTPHGRRARRRASLHF